MVPKHEEQIDDLLVEWELARGQGCELSIAQLCESYPELETQLREKIEILKATSWMLEDSADGDPTLATHETIDTRETLTVTEFVASLSESGILSDSECEAVRERRAEYPDESSARMVADRLIEEGLITEYQSAVLLNQEDTPLLLDRYIILDAIGSGGMGLVFKALHRSMERVVALKVLPSYAVNSPDKIARFQREIRAAARLSHPNIVAAYDAHEANGTYFLVMEYVAGEELNSLVREQGVLDPESAIHVTIQIADALAEAHRQGIVHRDIKPSNILIADDGVAKLLDLGLARIRPKNTDVASELTRDGLAMGTVAYMSPEQALDSKHADARSDIYGLGCALYFMLAGQSPFEGKNAVEMIVAHREQPLPDVAAACPEVGEPLKRVLSKMTEKSPERRFQTAEEVADSLRHILEGTNNDVLSMDERLDSRVTLAPVVSALMDSDRSLDIDSISNMRNDSNGDRTHIGSATMATVESDSNPHGDSTAHKRIGPSPVAKLWWPLLAIACIAVIVLAASMWLDGGLDGAAIGSGTSPGSFDEPLDQIEVLKWVFSHEGSVEARTEFGEREFNALDDVPKRFDITSIQIDVPSSKISLTNLARLPELRSLSLYGVDRELLDFSELSVLTQLQELQLNQCRFEDSDLSSLRTLTKLQSLDLSSTSISNDAIDGLAQISSLKELYLCGTKVTGAGLAKLRGLPNLTLLDLGDTSIDGKSFGANLPSLEELRISGTAITDDDLSELQEFKNLQTLVLDRCRISDAGLMQLKDLPKLSDLQLADTQVTDMGLSTLRNLKLETLDVTGTRITIDGVASLKDWPQLRHLYVADLSLTDDWMLRLAELHQLEYLDISENERISREGLLQLRALKNLETLRVDPSKNLLSSCFDELLEYLPNCHVFFEDDDQGNRTQDDDQDE